MMRGGDLNAFSIDLPSKHAPVHDVYVAAQLYYVHMVVNAYIENYYYDIGNSNHRFSELGLAEICVQGCRMTYDL